jgi:hypothetical protein
MMEEVMVEAVAVAKGEVREMRRADKTRPSGYATETRTGANRGEVRASGHAVPATSHPAEAHAVHAAAPSTTHSTVHATPKATSHTAVPTATEAASTAVPTTTAAAATATAASTAAESGRSQGERSYDRARDK